MVEERVSDGRRIAELLASELDGREDGVLDRVAVTNADRDVEPTADGARAYDVIVDGDDGMEDAVGGDDGMEGVGNGDEDELRLARAFVHDDRAHLEFDAGQNAAIEAAENGDLRVRPKATEPPRTLVFVESGAEVKRASDVVQSAVRSLDDRS